jgi:hypothetical protein
MTNSKRSNVVFMAAVSVVSIFGASACQPGESSGSGQAALGRGYYDSEEAVQDQGGATCSGYETRALVTKSGTYQDRVRAEVEAWVEKNKESSGSDYSHKTECKSGNGRAQTYFQCSAFKAFTTEDNFVTVTILSDSLSQQPKTIEAAKAVLEEWFKNKSESSSFVYKKDSELVSELPRSKFNAAQNKKNLPIAKLTYQVPGCK